MPFVIDYFVRRGVEMFARKECGMRHPSTARRDGDLSRLTSSSSSSSPSSSSITTDSGNGNGGNFYNNLPTDIVVVGTGSPRTVVVAECCNTAADLSVVGAGHSGDYDVAHGGRGAAGDNDENNGDIGGGGGGFRSTYLPAVIDPADWQTTQSRKRKDRQDSTSSSTQHDRKLIRSNSEEFIAGSGGGGGAAATDQRPTVHIRRVCSHEEFKRPPLQERRCNGSSSSGVASVGGGVRKVPTQLAVDGASDVLDVASNPSDPTAVAAVSDAAADADKWVNNEVQDILKETTAASMHRARNEISPARTRAFDFSHKIRVSPNRGGNGNGGGGSKNGNGNGSTTDADADGDHERRRSSERFCRARAPAGRKQSAKRPSKYLAARLRGGRDESVYKYDLQVSKVERRGFVAGVAGSNGKQRADDEENNDPKFVHSPPPPQKHHEVNDNNLNDNSNNSISSSSDSSSNTNTSNASNNGQHHHRHHHQQHHASNTPAVPLSSPNTIRKATDNIAATAALPWNFTNQSDDMNMPVVCPRFADATYAQVHHHRRIEPSHDFDDPAGSQVPSHRRRSSSSSDCTTVNSSVGGSGGVTAWRSLGHFMKSENLKTREIMQHIKPPPHSMQPIGYVGGGDLFAQTTPDERLRQTNKRMASLKRRIAGFEESFERENGYRPSQADKQNDRSIKNAIAEMHKLRREKQQLKADPMAACGARVGGCATEVAARLARVCETVQDIEVHLADKRTEEQRAFSLDALNTDELMQEKIAVQKALVYFESLHGRPATRDERDAARELYARYRTLKRLVNRTVSLQVSGISGVSELPTIMEHEAMQFVGPAATTAAATATTPLADTVGDAMPMAAAALLLLAPDSPLSELSTTESTDTTSSSVHENVHQLSLDELWHHLEVAREQKQEMRRTIKDFEAVFEQQNGRRMLKADRSMIEQTYAVYKQKKAKLRLLEALVKKHMTK